MREPPLFTAIRSITGGAAAAAGWGICNLIGWHARWQMGIIIGVLVALTSVMLSRNKRRIVARLPGKR